MEENLMVWVGIIGSLLASLALLIGFILSALKKAKAEGKRLQREEDSQKKLEETVKQVAQMQDELIELNPVKLNRRIDDLESNATDQSLKMKKVETILENLVKVTDKTSEKIDIILDKMSVK